MSHTRAKAKTRSDRLLHLLSSFDDLLIVAHDNPDPDAIASGWAILTLVEEKLAKPVRLIAGGAIVRAENRHMVELLSPPIELVEHIQVAEGGATILVDCQVGASNHLLTREKIVPTAVIDHHLNGDTQARKVFRDIRCNVAASATIAASYLRQQRVEPGPKLSTALLYGIQTETRGAETHYSWLDRSMLPWLTKRADPALLAEIESAPLTRDYFSDLVLAMQNTFTYDDAALCLLPRAEGQEIVGELSDLLIRCRGIRRVLCGAVVGCDLLVSVRTERGSDNAAKLLQTTLAGLGGGGGGHAHRAGGKISGVGHGGKISEELHEQLRSCWLAACQLDRQRGTRLVAKREIVENL